MTQLASRTKIVCNFSSSRPVAAVLACCNTCCIGVTLTRQQVLQSCNFMIMLVLAFELLAQKKYKANLTDCPSLTKNPKLLMIQRILDCKGEFLGLTR